MKINQTKFNDYSDTELALLVWLGTFGVGAQRKEALGKRYAAVQNLVEKQARTGVCEPGENYDLDKLVKAVQETYTGAAEDLIAAIKKEAKK